MIKRIFLFVLTNILVMTMLSIIMAVLGVGPYLTASGIDYGSLMVFCAVWGMGGSFISLLMSKQMAKWFMGVQVIDPETRDPEARELLNIVRNLAMGAKIKMPEVGIYNSPEVNAFATGPSRDNALVAVSSGILSRMDRAQLEGVLGHELTHVANGDMVTMTLIQGVVNAFTMFFARIVAFVVANAMRSDDNRGPSYLVEQLLVMVFQIIFGMLGMIVVCAFSRRREFRADKGGATLAGRDKMISALQALQRTSELVDNRQAAFQSLKISGEPRGFMALMMTHPPLEKRIDRLRQMQ